MDFCQAGRGEGRRNRRTCLGTARTPCELRRARRSAVAGRATLLDPSRHQPMAIHAMGGAGKSIIAKALCNDDDVQRAFPGGVFWLELGQAPDVAAVFGRLLQDMGGAAATQESRKDARKSHGSRAIAECLLVIDNVWQRTHIESLLMVMARDSPRTRILLTTRFADIARDLKSHDSCPSVDGEGSGRRRAPQRVERNRIQKAPLREQICESVGTASSRGEAGGRTVARKGCRPLAVHLRSRHARAEAAGARQRQLSCDAGAAEPGRSGRRGSPPITRTSPFFVQRSRFRCGRFSDCGAQQTDSPNRTPDGCWTIWS